MGRRLKYSNHQITELVLLAVFNNSTTSLTQQLQLDYDSESQRKKKNRKRDPDDSEASDEDSEEGKPKRRGRPRSGKDIIKGFTDAEIRRFVRSYKKFGAPLSRYVNMDWGAFNGIIVLRLNT